MSDSPATAPITHHRPSIMDTEELSDNQLTQVSKESIRELLSYCRRLEENVTSSTTPIADQSSMTPNTKSILANFASTPIAVSTASMTTTTEERLRFQQQEATRRENVLVMRLTTKEQEVQDYLTKLDEMRMQTASTGRQVLMDPAVNAMFARMRRELREANEKVEQTKQELNAWQFTPDSNTGKRLMAKCRTLMQENEELGKLVSSGRVAKVESELAMLRQQCDQLRATQQEDHELLFELEGEMVRLQATIVLFQEKLRKSHDDNRRMRRMLDLGQDASLDEELERSTKKKRRRESSMEREEDREEVDGRHRDRGGIDEDLDRGNSTEDMGDDRGPIDTSDGNRGAATGEDDRGGRTEGEPEEAIGEVEQCVRDMMNQF